LPKEKDGQGRPFFTSKLQIAYGVVCGPPAPGGLIRKSDMLVAFAAAPRVLGTCRVSHIKRSTDSSCMYVSPSYPCFTFGPTSTSGICPPPFLLSLSQDSSQPIINNPSF